jgi:predicted dehydrogenase
MSMSAPSDAPHLSLGFIGGGLSSAVGQTHFSASGMDSRWRLDAGAFSRDPDVNAATGRDWHVHADRVYGTWRDMIAAEVGRLDAVAVLTPTPDHAETVCALLAAGIPVICEKALVSSLSELNRVRGVFTEADHPFLAVTFNYSGYPMVRELRTMIQAGDLGRIQQVHFEMPQEGFTRAAATERSGAQPVVQAWRRRDGSITTMSLDLGVHLHHLAWFLLADEPSEVIAEDASYSGLADVVDTTTIWTRYRDGKSATWWFTKAALGYRNGLRIRVFGDRASAEWVQVEPETLTVNHLDGSRVTIERGGPTRVAGAKRYARFKPGHPTGFLEAFANLYADLADALISHRHADQRQTEFVHGLDEAGRGLTFLASARQAALERRWCRLDETLAVVERTK